MDPAKDVWAVLIQLTSIYTTNRGVLGLACSLGLPTFSLLGGRVEKRFLHQLCNLFALPVCPVKRSEQLTFGYMANAISRTFSLSEKTRLYFVGYKRRSVAYEIAVVPSAVENLVFLKEF